MAWTNLIYRQIGKYKYNLRLSLYQTTSDHLVTGEKDQNSKYHLTGVDELCKYHLCWWAGSDQL